MLQEKYNDYQIILASNSPRRKQFLTDLGLTFTINPANVNEAYPSHLKGKDIALYIAQQKASVFNNLQANELVITCDTIVWIDGVALGKPENSADAKQMLQQLSGKTHEVISAVCIKSNQKEQLFYDVTKVSFNTLNPSDIAYYVETFQPFDKAGSYGIQEWIGLVGIEKINGSYTNVVGMPMEKLYKELMKW
ncbi:Maf family nucleotide pyrophosphatase [Paenimyroides aestuarii]|uniref:dTTP/UTP pyrophosphatase n=1 Tax=Paenimyroides aestuarii TaxID=2968490 RepID=A0ABY5NWT0_9FLAO|nr:Maf family nucleotide pyrophosphatase [Paenimyroides aestuarii]UUV22842.1 Maf family nucleotide pyrophosphatase [Paenimyroides aestuarii]